MSEQRFTLHRSTDGTIATVRDSITEAILAGPVDPDSAERILNAANAADAERTLALGVDVGVYTVEDVSARVTDDSSLWAAGPCVYCGGNPCTFSTDECVVDA